MTTTVQAFFDNAARLGPRLAWKHGARSFSFTEAARAVRRTARGLLALGVQPGEKVAIVGANTPEWVMADLGAIAAGAVPAPIYPTLTAEQACGIAAHSGAVVAFVQDRAQLDKLRSQRAPSLRFFVLLSGLPDAADVLGFEALLEKGDAIPESALDARVAALQDGDLATLIYTSGTTGPAKGAMLTQKNLFFAAQTAQRVARIGPDDILVSYLPLSHVAEQMISVHGPTVSGAQIWFCDVLERVPEVLREARPTLFFGVPRVWEKMQARVEEAVLASPPRRQKLFERARCSTGLTRRLFDKLVLAKVRARLGLSRSRFSFTGAAAMNRQTLGFFDSLGVPILDIWGMTESSAMGTSNLPGARKRGTIGRPTEGCEVRLAPDGEILTRGPHVFLGYYQDETATKEALDAEGFLHTGDVGEIDPDGYVRITDRKKDLLITSGGKNVSPQNIEGQLGRIKGVGQAVVVGDARKHLAALIVPDLDAARAIAGAAVALAELPTHPVFLEHVGKGIATVNGQLAPFETVKKFRILPVQFSVESGELTPTLKLKRKVVAQKFAREIDELFRG